MDREGYRKILARLARLIGDDSYAASFQTMGQYRASLLSAIWDLMQGRQPEDTTR